MTVTVEEVRRDRWGRPLIVPPEGGKPVPYTRCTTYIKALDDTALLTAWAKRMVLVGATVDPSLVERAAFETDKRTLDALAEEALVAARANAKRDKGTLLHALTEYADRGEPLPETGTVDGVVWEVTDADRADIAAYVKATEDLTVTHIERFTVCDELQVAGTPDRLVSFDGQTYIADLKTGSVDYAALSIAMQLSVYSRSQFYDTATGERTPLPGVSQDLGIVVHLPAGSAECRLLWVDLETGWRGVQAAGVVRKWRGIKAKDVFSPFGGAS